MDKLLSICMIVRDEEKNLKRCLDSFLPIINEDWCELLITDTGSVDSTVEIAKKYTDKVYFHKWNDDFSDARNASIKHAKGQRVMIIDADEELAQESIAELRDVLTGTKHADKNSIFFTIKNFYNKDFGMLFSELIQARVFTREGFSYQYPVHNRPKTATPYLFAEGVKINHYGYLFVNDEKLRKKKTDRTLPMLMKEYKKNPDDIHVLVHLAKGFRSMNDMDSLIYFGEKFVEGMRKVHYTDGWTSYLEVFVGMVGAYLRKGDEKNALRIHEESKRYSQRIAEVPLILGTYYAGHDNDKAAQYFETVLEIKSKRGSPYEKLLTSNIKVVLPAVLNFLATYWYKNNDLAKAGTYLNQGIYMNNNRLGIRWDVWNNVNLGRGILGELGGDSFPRPLGGQDEECAECGNDVFVGVEKEELSGNGRDVSEDLVSGTENA